MQDVTARSPRGLALLFIAGFLSALCIPALHAQSSATRIYKVVTYSVPQNNLAAFLAQCKVNAEATRKEAGVIDFQILQPTGKPDTVMLLEEYRDQAASDAHTHTPHFQASMQAVQSSGASRTAVLANPLLP